MNLSSFSVNKPEDSLGLLLWQTTVTWQRQIKSALEPYGVSHAQFVVLAILLWLTEQNKMPIQAEIIKISKLDKMTVSKSLKKLTAEQYTRRQEDASDTRAKAVILTSKGKSLAQKLVPVVENIDTRFFGRVSATERQTLLKMFSALSQ